MWSNAQFTVDLVIFTEEILKGLLNCERCFMICYYLTFKAKFDAFSECFPVKNESINSNFTLLFL